MNLQTDIKKWMRAFFLVPAAILLVIANIANWQHFRSVHAREYDEHLAEAHSRIEQFFYAEAARLRSLALLPHVDSLLTVTERAQRHLSPTGRFERIEEMEAQWSDLQRDSLFVRNILDNSVAELFRHLVEGQPDVEQILLTDSEGALIAASEKTAQYAFGREDWWILAREQRGSQVYSMGRLEDGRLELAMPITYQYRDAVFRGALRQIVRWSDEHVAPTEKRNRFSCAFIGNDAWPISGPRSVFDRYADSLIDAFGRTPPPESGWRGGVRFKAQPVGAGIVWARPLHVVVFRPEFRFPPVIFGPFGAGLFISLTLFVLLIRISDNAARKRFIDPYTDFLRAGQWVFQNAPKRLRRAAAETSAGESIKVGESRVLEEELDSWITRLQEDVKAAISARAREVQNDLELAKDFQQAYLNRSFPKIPEVHYEGRLRLEFHHRYRPALALGGDFYDVLPLASDCAGIFISDVMGHGARSALITAMLRTLLRDLSGQGRNARHFLTELNKQFCALLRGFPNPLFASAFYFVPDVTSRIATYSAAGHPPPYHVRRTMGRIMRLRIPRSHGAALGLLPDEEYPGGHVRLINGDVFLFFTDGVYEATNPQGEEFGLERLEKIMRRLMYKDVRVIVDSIMEAVVDFAAGEPFLDDICLFAVEVTTAPESARGKKDTARI